MKKAIMWTICFGVLLIWTLYIASASSSMNNGKIYVESEGVLKQATQSKVLELLFKHDISFTEKSMLPESKCSIRARSDDAKANINIKIQEYPTGKGTITLTDSRTSYKLDVIKILNTGNVLSFETEGTLSYNRDRRYNVPASITVENGKLHFTVDQINVELDVISLNGCDVVEEMSYVMIDNGELDEGRSIEEVRDILDDYDFITDEFEHITSLYKDYWWAVLATPVFVS
ncbi:hypothetical protein H6503_03890 [Candidatus Woesearchaeota archaeon]|nr:hypothetical protein [Candidatus Woesearchaeota archaeon]